MVAMMTIESAVNSLLESILLPSKEYEDCSCEGKCLCHLVGVIGGESCPPTCIHHVNHLDGCHRCDPCCKISRDKEG